MDNNWKYYRSWKHSRIINYFKIDSLLISQKPKLRIVQNIPNCNKIANIWKIPQPAEEIMERCQSNNKRTQNIKLDLQIYQKYFINLKETIKWSLGSKQHSIIIFYQISIIWYQSLEIFSTLESVWVYQLLARLLK